MRITVLSLIITCFINVFGNKTSSEIYVDLQKFASLKKVLYIAAHPDDENTRALAWFSLGEHAQTAYYSLTRGDGGQNLIGNELGDDLGILRTYELLAARSYDKAEQYFSKAVDFGYSKSAEESFEKWGKEAMMEEVVLMIRKFKPDVIITRFPPDDRGGHGHHTASAILAIEAFDLAADPKFLPYQVEKYGTWQTGSLYWNASTWANKNLETDALNNPDYIIKDIGGYNELLGMSYNEIGTIARSQHKCQGFGAIVEKGTSLEYFEYMKGKKLKEDFFENKTERWSNVIDIKFEKELQKVLRNFHFTQPERNIPALIKIKSSIEKMPNSQFKEEKLKTLKQIIFDCLGLDIEIIADDYAFAEKSESLFRLQILNRSNTSIVLSNFNNNSINKELPKNSKVVEEIKIINEKAPSIPYWLEKPFKDTYFIEDESNILKAKNDATFEFPVSVKIFNQNIEALISAEYKWRDPAYGERRREVISSPHVVANFNQNTVILQAGQTKKVEIKIHGFKENIEEEITLETPKGWTLKEHKFPINIKKKHDEIFLNIELQATEESERGFMKLKDSKGNYLKSITEIAYDHIPPQTYFRDSKMECVKLNAQILPGKIAYIKGVEDDVPLAIKQLGFDVDIFETEDLSSIELSNYKSVVLGIRIYNTNPELKNFNDKLFSYVKEGGNLIMQYNTVSRFTPNEKFGGPMPFEITRFRVTEEDASVTFLNREHPLLNEPNKITEKDFDHWVQERGLYFAGNWDVSYQPILAWNDKGEDEQTGALIVSKYGKGQFIYTGISFFRQLPAGVEGAYRLFANLLSYSNE